MELEEILQRAALICPVLSAAIATGDLVVRSSGQRGPCLDLRTISVGMIYRNIYSEVLLLVDLSIPSTLKILYIINRD